MPPCRHGDFAVSALLDFQRCREGWAALAGSELLYLFACETELGSNRRIRQIIFRDLVARERVIALDSGMSCHTDNVTQGHNEGNSECARFALKSAVTVWHSLGMPKPKQKPKHFIKEWRTLHAKITQEVAAERSGLDRSHISKVENGRRKYDEEFLEAAAKVYRCTPADLIGRHPQDKAA